MKTEFMTQFESLSKEERLVLIDMLFGWFCGSDDHRTDKISEDFRTAVTRLMPKAFMPKEAAHV